MRSVLSLLLLAGARANVLPLDIPEGQTWESLLTADGQVAHWTTHDGVRVQACSAVPQLEAFIEDFLGGPATTEFWLDPMVECALEQHFDLSDSDACLSEDPNYNSSCALPGGFSVSYAPGPFQQRANEERNVVQISVDFASPSDGMVVYPRRDHSQYDEHCRFSKESHDCGNPFHNNEPLFQLNVSQVEGKLPAREKDVYLSVSGTRGPLRGYLVANSDIPYTEPEPTAGISPEDACAMDCSCTARFMHYKWNEVKVRRRVRRALQGTGCAMEGMLAEPHNDWHCCEGLLTCEGSLKCVTDQTQCHSEQAGCAMEGMHAEPHNDWHCCEGLHTCEGSLKCVTDQAQCHAEDPGNITDPFAGLSHDCPTYVDCESNPECRLDFLSIAAHYMDASSATHLHSMTSRTEERPYEQSMYETFQCMASKHLDMMDAGQQCNQVLVDCMTHPFCKKLLALDMFLHETDKESYKTNVRQAPGFQPHADELLKLVHDCHPISFAGEYEEPDHHNPEHPPGPLLTIPLDRVPCACGGGTASVSSRSYATDMDRFSNKEFSSRVDLCFASKSYVGALAIQLDGKMEWAESGGVAWETPPNITIRPDVSEKIIPCFENPESSACDHELYDNLGKFYGDSTFGPVHCGPYAKRHLYSNETGYMEDCAAIRIAPSPEFFVPELLKKQAMGQDAELVARAEFLDPLDLDGIYPYDKIHYAISYNSTLGIEAKFYSEKMVESYTVVSEPIEMESSDVTWENCNETCSCDRLFLAERWKEHNEHDSSSNPTPLLLLDAEIPCACDPHKTNRHHAEINRWGDQQKDFFHQQIICSRGLHVIGTDYSMDVWTLPEKFDFVCDCDLTHESLEHCKKTCRLVRGPWAWTCDAMEEEGFKTLDPFSEQVEEMKSTCH